MKDLDRRVSVAPMMDYTDNRGFSRVANDLRSKKMVCTNFVTADTKLHWARSPLIRATVSRAKSLELKECEVAG
jgi:tRNA-dihydrouridine synthase